ncbi:hypothetical protein [Maricaulis salignorans]|uniref:hypothetical protein n=1 Tax=Maricaulis salignorans TaxID=144026 RepID=UPI001F404327|nr:hypothetical protein [Maricaulis salignorans]
MNDWGGSRKFTRIHCEPCRKAQEEIQRQRDANNRQRETLLEEAKAIARERYLATWLGQFEGLTKKDIWCRLTKGEGYPVLQTFYRHVRDTGLQRYLTRWFEDHILIALEQVSVTDAEVIGLLQRRDAIPQYRERHPWQ